MAVIIHYIHDLRVYIVRLLTIVAAQEICKCGKVSGARTSALAEAGLRPVVRELNAVIPNTDLGQLPWIGMTVL